MCGDPPNIIIGTSLGFSFADFIMNTGAIAAVSLIFTLVYFYFVCRKELSQSGKDIDTSKFPTPASAIKDKAGFGVSCVIFGIAVVLLVTHSATHLDYCSKTYSRSYEAGRLQNSSFLYRIVYCSRWS